jgi:uncharacterized phage protein (TIGR02220 family)
MERDFKGVWIPKELYLDENLSWAEKILLVEIDSLDRDDNGCFASNEYLSKFLMLKEGTVANMIIKLIDSGYLIKRGFDGRKRYISVNQYFTKTLKQGSQNYESRVHKNMNSESIKTLKQDSQKSEHSNTYNNTVNNTFNKESSFVEKIEESVEDIKYYFELTQILNLLTEYTKVNYKIPTSKSVLLRYGAYKLVKERLEDGSTLEECIKVIELKYNEWKGTEFMRYLIPETIFRKSNFEKYLTQSQIQIENNLSQTQKPLIDDKGNYANTDAGRELFISNIRKRAEETFRK